VSDEQCGHPTGDGGECSNPTTDDGDTDRCWIPTHNDPDAENPGGRPSKFNDQRARDAIEAARQSKSEAGCARAAGVSHTTLANWKDKNPEFTDESGEKQDFLSAFRRARRDGETILVQGGLRNDNVDTSMAKFLLSTSFDYVKTEKKEVNMDADIDADVAGDVTAEFVTYTADNDETE